MMNENWEGADQIVELLRAFVDDVDDAVQSVTPECVASILDDVAVNVRPASADERAAKAHDLLKAARSAEIAAAVELARARATARSIIEMAEERAADLIGAAESRAARLEADTEARGYATYDHARLGRAVPATAIQAVRPTPESAEVWPVTPAACGKTLDRGSLPAAAIRSQKLTEQPQQPSRAVPDDVSDEIRTIVARAQAGDAEAFGLIYDRYLDTVFRFIYFRVGSRSLAEDLTADTFLRALKRIGSFTWQGCDLGAWLITIARNLVADQFKSGRSRLKVTTGETRAAVQAERGPENSAEAAVVDHITNVALLTAVKQLGPEQQECIVLRFLHGFSVAETATVMGKNESAIKALQYRAVRALHRLLPDEFPDSEEQRSSAPAGWPAPETKNAGGQTRSPDTAGVVRATEDKSPYSKVVVPATVEIETSFRLVGPGATSVPTRATLRYDPDDPYAVNVVFVPEDAGASAVEWTLDRELLVEGLDEPAGIGDVRLWPWSTPHGDYIALALSTPDGNALFQVPRSVVVRFLRRTYVSVPRGHENVDVDGVGSLLDEAPRDDQPWHGEKR